MGTYSIRVIDAQDRGIPRALVCVKYGWSLSNCRYTDQDGWVTLQEDRKLRPGFIIIDHEDIGKVPAREGASYVIRV